MGNKISQPSGHSIKVVENQEMKRVMVEEEKPLDTITSSSSTTNSGRIWPNVKPFVNGGVAGLLRYSFFFFTGLLVHKTRPPNMHKRMPGVLLIEATYASMAFGSFETLKRKVEASNKRMPLTLYQEACCGLTSGAVTAFLWFPMFLAEGRVKAAGNRISILQDLYHKCANEGVLAMWKGGWYHANVTALLTVGMLTPYNRCFNYFRESVCLSEEESILGNVLFLLLLFIALGAGAVSGFFGAACSFPPLYVHGKMKNMKPNANGKYPYSSSLNCAFKIFKSGGPFAFFIGFPKVMFHPIASIMVLWYFFEKIRKHEESIGM